MTENAKLYMMQAKERLADLLGLTADGTDQVVLEACAITRIERLTRENARLKGDHVMCPKCSTMFVLDAARNRNGEFGIGLKVPLSKRVRAGSEVPEWVFDEITKLEAAVEVLCAKAKE